MEYPFIKGAYHDYKAVMQWIDQKTEMLEKKEYMYELFQKLDEAISGSEQVDTKCMLFRMALESTYIDEPIKFPDWEFGDPLAESLEADMYTPPLSFQFFWNIYKIVGHKLWLEIEEEFKRELPSNEYNKKGWMQNKPKLFKIINKKFKPTKNAKMAPVTTNEIAENHESDEETLLEMDDGCILQVRPKFRGAGKTWKRNFTKKFNLQQSGNNKWAQRQNNRFPGNAPNNRPSNNNSNPSNRFQNNGKQNGDKPTADQMWKCKICQNEGNIRKFRGDQQCNVHKYRPKWFGAIPLAGIRNIEGANEQSEVEIQNQQEYAAMKCIKTIMIGDDDEDSQ